MSSREWIVRTDKLLQDQQVGSVILRLMMFMNDIVITNTEMFEWEKTEDPKKKFRWRGAVLYFGRMQSAHLFEALSIIREIKSDPQLLARVSKCTTQTASSFQVVASFLDSDDCKLMAKMRNVAAFHYDKKLSMRRLAKIVQAFPDHRTSYSIGNDTLDWYFELGDLVFDEVVIREVFEISEDADIKEAALKVLNRLHVIGVAFTNFAGYFIREYCAK
jgi:hypothetical protein